MVTIEDVARAANVSAKTVSRVITGKGYVSEQTRARVKVAIGRLGYTPNRVASSMVTGRTMTLGMVVPDVSYPFFSEIVLGAERVASKAGYNLILCNTAESDQQESRVLEYLAEARVDGVIMGGARSPERDLLLGLARHRACVSINHPIPPELGGNIRSDHAGGMMQAVEHLLQYGRKTIAYMSGLERAFAEQERLRAFMQTMLGAGRALHQELIVPYSASFEDGYHTLYEWLDSVDAGSAQWSEMRARLGVRGAYRLLAGHPEVDGIVCYDDQLAFGVLQACAQLGRRVPEDVAVVGCNDLPLASQVSPALTTQHIPRYQMGAAAAKMLLDCIEGGQPLGEKVFPHRLVVRDSAPARQDKEE